MMVSFVFLGVTQILCFIGNRTAMNLSTPINIRFAAESINVIISPILVMCLCSGSFISAVGRSIPKDKNANPETRSLADKLRSNCSYDFKFFRLLHNKMISTKFSIVAKPPTTINEMFPTLPSILKYVLGIFTFKCSCDLLN